MSTYAIGDIQGCIEPLRCLLKKIQFNPAKDHLWLAGDLVNRGPDSLAVLRFLYDIRHALTIVLGNHDLHFLALALGHRESGKHDTLHDVLAADEIHHLVDWLRHCKLVHHDSTSGFTMVHAGIPPQWTIAQALEFSSEVEAAIQSDDIDEFLVSMYGNNPNIWHDQLQGFDRLRIITNYFTRMRFCTAEGELELHTKANALEAPPGYRPWYQHTARKNRDAKIIFGHWAALQGKVDTPGIYALDTGCVWGGELTAMRLEDEARFSCSCHVTAE